MRLGPLVRNRLAGAYSRFVSNDRVRSAVRRSLVAREELTASDGCRWFDAEEQFEVGEPYSVDPLPPEIKRMVGTHRIGRPFVCELADVELVGPEAVAVTRENEYVFEESLGSIELLLRSLLGALGTGVIPRRGSTGSEPDIETAVSLVGPWCRGYYHWFSDYLLRLEGVEHYAEETGTQPTLIVPRDPPEWMLTSLELAGFGDYERLEWTASRARVRSLVVPSMRRETDLTKPPVGFIFSPRAYRWLGQRIRSNVERAGEPTKVFVSREKAAERHVVNQDELMAVLGDRGFEKYVLEELPFREQVRLFANAEAIVAPNGAGLINMIYGEDPDVVTLFGAYVNACYPNLADTLGFGSAIVRCEPRALDMRVDPSKVTDVLDQL